MGEPASEEKPDRYYFRFGIIVAVISFLMCSLSFLLWFIWIFGGGWGTLDYLTGNILIILVGSFFIVSLVSGITVLGSGGKFKWPYLVQIISPIFYLLALLITGFNLVLLLSAIVLSLMNVPYSIAQLKRLKNKN